jgi:GNAT superfamily N-acetyltransferase
VKQPHYRKAVCADANAVRHVLMETRQCGLSYWMPELFDSGDFDEDELTEWVRGSIIANCIVTLADVSDHIVGFVAVSLSPEAGATPEIENLFVLPSNQGQCIGYGLIQIAKAEAPSGLVLRVHEHNRKARAFYERNGFRFLRRLTLARDDSGPDMLDEWRP